MPPAAPGLLNRLAIEGLAIINGFGRSLGDSLIGLQALHAAQTVTGFPRPVLVRQDFARPMLDAIYRHADFADVLIGAPPERVARTIDITDFAFDPGFRGVAMIDYFLTRLGLDPATIPATLKRNSWLAPRIRTTRPEGAPERYILVCPDASMKLRDMPQDIHASLLRACSAAVPGLAVLTQGDPAGTAARHIPPQPSLEALCGLVAGATCILSTDTAMVHLADAFSIPCLAVFTTHRPEWRVRDYPGCTPLHLPVPLLPEALEFSRGPADLAAIAATWHAAADRLTAAAARFAATHAPAPAC